MFNINFKNNYTNKRNIIGVSIMLLLLGYNILTKHGILDIFDGVIMIAIFLLLSFDYKVISIFLLLPFQSILVINQISFYSIIQIILTLNFIVTKDFLSKFKTFAILTLLSTQLVTIINFQTSVIDIVNFIYTLILFLAIFDYIKDKPFIMRPVKFAYLIGLFIATTIGYYLFVNNVTLFGIDSYRFSGLWINPNILGFQIVLGIALLLDMIIKNQNKWYIYLPFITVFFYFISLTYSRSAVIAVFIVLLFFLIKFLKLILKNLNKNKSPILIMMIFLVFPIGLFLFFVFLYPIIKERTIIGDESGFGGGRILLLYNNLTWLFSNGPLSFLINGVGVNNSLSYFANNGYMTFGTHNTFTELFIETGLIGILLWLYIILSNYEFLQNRFNKINLLILIVPLFYMFTAHLHTSNILYMAFIFCYNISSNNQEKNNNDTMNLGYNHEGR